MKRFSDRWTVFSDEIPLKFTTTIKMESNKTKLWVSDTFEKIWQYFKKAKDVQEMIGSFKNTWFEWNCFRKETNVNEFVFRNKEWKWSWSSLSLWRWIFMWAHTNTLTLSLTHTHKHTHTLDEWELECEGDEKRERDKMRHFPLLRRAQKMSNGQNKDVKSLFLVQLLFCAWIKLRSSLIVTLIRDRAAREDLVFNRVE